MIRNQVAGVIRRTSRWGGRALAFGVLFGSGCHKQAETTSPPPKQKKVYRLEVVGSDDGNGGVYTQYPNYINMIARVTNGLVTRTNKDGRTVPDFSNPDYYVTGLRPATESGGNFSILENGVEVEVEAGLRVQSLSESLQLHTNLLLDVSGSVGEAGLLQTKNASKRLFARPCTSDELAARPTPCFSYRYSDWDAQAGQVVKKTEKWRSMLKENQVVRIFVFSDKVTQVALRQTDGEGNRYKDKARQVLDTIDREIALGVDSTNLYGALLAGLEDLKQVRSLGDPARGLVDGIVVAFTDGAHTSGDIVHGGTTLSPEEAIARILRVRGEADNRRGLRLITIGVDTPELKETIATGDMAGGGVRDLQNAGYLGVKSYNKLSSRFDEAFLLIDRYAGSLYRVYYRTPKTGSQTVQIELQVTCPRCERAPDGSIPDHARARASVETRAFYQMPPGVYIDDPVLGSDGAPDVARLGDDALRGPDALTIRARSAPPTSDAYRLVLANHPERSVGNPQHTQLLRLHTYVRANDNRFRPAYTVTSSAESVLTVHGVARMSAIESVALVECLSAGSATVTVTDQANGKLSDTIACECATGATQ